MEKVAWENTQYLKNGEILKSGEKRKFCKGYGLCKICILGLNFKVQKIYEKQFAKDTKKVLKF